MNYQNLHFRTETQNGKLVKKKKRGTSTTNIQQTNKLTISFRKTSLLVSVLPNLSPETDTSQNPQPRKHHRKCPRQRSRAKQTTRTRLRLPHSLLTSPDRVKLRSERFHPPSQTTSETDVGVIGVRGHRVKFSGVTVRRRTSGFPAGGERNTTAFCMYRERKIGTRERERNSRWNLNKSMGFGNRKREKERIIYSFNIYFLFKKW